jgi:class 3 adenylate cyclase/tetratricopeptide (TPR) repeat protein
MAICAQCGTDNPDVAKFCMSCAAPLASAETPPPEPPRRHEERRPVTAVFVDIVGSTSRAEQLDPEDVLALLEPYYARLRHVLERHGGSVEKFIGDAVVALFGAPIAHEDDPERAVRAGLAILAAIEALNEEDPNRELRVRVGVTTGEAIVSLDARIGEGQGMAWGDVLNTAARLQSAAPINGVLVDERTYRACRDAIDFREAEPITAKGKAEPVPVWEVRGIHHAPTRRASESAFVGRTAELERLTTVWYHVTATREPALALVVAEPGLGKTRLLHEVAARAEGADVRLGACLPYGEGITYWPVVQIMRDAAEILVGDPVDVVSSKLDVLLGKLPLDDLDQLRTIASTLSNLLGAPMTPRGSYTTTDISQAELHWGIRRILELFAVQRPLLLVLEDLHWAEPTFVELVESLSDLDGPVLVLASARPELGDKHPHLLVEQDGRTVIALDVLSEDESATLVSELVAQLEERGLPRSVVDRLVRNANGNPLFLEETIHMLAEADSLDASAVESLPIPESLQSLVAARLDGLPGFERRLAQHSSVAGMTFWSGAAARLDDRTEPPDDLLESLAGRTVLHEHGGSAVAGEREWEFKHVVIRDVAYGRLPKSRRVGLHVRFADWIDELPDGGEEFVEILAYHLEQACLVAREVGRSEMPPPTARAIKALSEAGEKAERREGAREAHRFYSRALELVRDEDLTKAVELRLRAARALVGLGDLRGAGEELERVVREAGELQLDAVRCEALVALGNMTAKQGSGTRARELLIEAEHLAARLGDRRLEIRAVFESAFWAAWFGRDIDASLAKATEAVALSEAEGESVLGIEGFLRIGAMFANIARLVDAEEALTRCSELAADLGSVRDAARAETMLGLIRYYKRDLEGSREYLLRAQDWLERTADGYFIIQNLRALALVALALGDPDEAEARLRAAYPLAIENRGYFAVEVSRLLTVALILLDRVEEARAIASIALADVPEEDADALAAAKRIEAELAAVDGDAEAMRAGYSEAVRLLESVHTYIDLGETHIEFAVSLRAIGDHGAADRELTAADAIFASIGAATATAAVWEARPPAATSS